MAQVSWKVSGHLRVEDFLIPNTILDEDDPSGTDVVERPLRGVKVQVKASTLANRGFNSWGTEVTNDDGYFEITQRKNEKPRKFQILVELNDSDLSVRSKANVKERLNHLPIPKPGGQPRYRSWTVCVTGLATAATFQSPRIGKRFPGTSASA